MIDYQSEISNIICRENRNFRFYFQLYNFRNEKVNFIWKGQVILEREASYYGSWSTKIRPQVKIDNFALKNSNIIIEGLSWKRKD